MIRTRFQVDRVVRECKAPADIETHTVVLKSVHGPGEIQLPMQIETVDQFPLGATFNVDFSRAIK